MRIKKSIFSFIIYKLIIISSVLLLLFGQDTDGLAYSLCVISIILLCISYWYFVLEVLYGEENIINKLKKEEKIILILDLLIKLIEHFMVYIFSMSYTKIILFLLIGILIIDILLELKIYNILLVAINRECIIMTINNQEKERYTEKDRKNLMNLYLSTVLFIIMGVVQIFQIIMGNEIFIQLIIRCAVIIVLINNYIKISTNEKKVYIPGKNYLVNIAIFMTEIAIYWIVNNIGIGIYIKATSTFASIICCEGLLAGQFAKKYNTTKNNDKF